MNQQIDGSFSAINGEENNTCKPPVKLISRGATRRGLKSHPL